MDIYFKIIAKEFPNLSGSVMINSISTRYAIAKPNPIKNGVKYDVIKKGVEIWQINLEVTPYGANLLKCFESELTTTGILPKHYGTLLIAKENRNNIQKEAVNIQQIDRTTMEQIVDS